MLHHVRICQVRSMQTYLLWHRKPARRKVAFRVHFRSAKITFSCNKTEPMAHLQWGTACEIQTCTVAPGLVSPSSVMLGSLFSKSYLNLCSSVLLPLSPFQGRAIKHCPSCLIWFWREASKYIMTTEMRAWIWDMERDLSSSHNETKGRHVGSGSTLSFTSW